MLVGSIVNSQFEYNKNALWIKNITNDLAMSAPSLGWIKTRPMIVCARAGYAASLLACH